MVDTLPAISALSACIESTNKDNIVKFLDCDHADILAQSIIHYNNQQYSLSWEKLREFCDLHDMKCCDRNLHNAILRTADKVTDGCYGVEDNSEGSITARYTNTGDSYSEALLWLQFDLDHMPNELDKVVSKFEYDLIILGYWALSVEVNEAVEYLES